MESFDVAKRNLVILFPKIYKLIVSTRSVISVNHDQRYDEDKPCIAYVDDVPLSLLRFIFYRSTLFFE